MMRLGERFHRLVERTEIGIDPAQVAVRWPCRPLTPRVAKLVRRLSRASPADLPTLPSRSSGC